MVLAPHDGRDLNRNQPRFPVWLPRGAESSVLFEEFKLFAFKTVPIYGQFICLSCAIDDILTSPLH